MCIKLPAVPYYLLVVIYILKCFACSLLKPLKVHKTFEAEKCVKCFKPTIILALIGNTHYLRTTQITCILICSYLLVEDTSTVLTSFYL